MSAPSSALPTVEVVDASRAAQLPQLSLDDLDGDHRHLLVRAIARILGTELAEVTYAQIIDGLPIADAARDRCIEPYIGHPIFEVHSELCPGMLEKAREFRDSFQPAVLTFDAQLLRGYRACSPGSRGFKARLIELVVVAIHQIATLLFELDTSVHKNDGVTDWAPPKSEELYWDCYPDGPYPTMFYHEWYVDHDQYPRGVADMVGYWAESRILGGVVLFDRRNQDAVPPGDPDAVYFHPDRYDVTYRICQLLPDQRTALLHFLLADEPPSASPLPILPDRNNTVRVDPEEPIRTTHVYRDLWERKELGPDAHDERMRDVLDREEYPTDADWYGARRRAYDRRSRIEYRENYEKVGRRRDSGESD